MDLEALKKQHPETYAAAHAEGVAAERDRVTAHLTLGTKFGELPIALESIKDGSGLTLELSQRYIEAATNKLETRLRQIDCDEAGAILDGVSTEPEVGDLGDQVVAEMERQGFMKKPAKAG
jgi:hypothetical protein